MTEICLSCRQEWHNECGDPCCCADIRPVEALQSPPSLIEEPDRPLSQNPEAFKDPHSTGRKRAAKLYPLDYTLPCEWRNLKQAGGGTPIVGCLTGVQQSRHHGPDKNTLNNTQGNVHRICHDCHNNWHSVNDPNYVWGSDYSPHNSELEASPAELGNELLRRSKGVKNVTRNQGD